MAENPTGKYRVVGKIANNSSVYLVALAQELSEEDARQVLLAAVTSGKFYELTIEPQ